MAWEWLAPVATGIVGIAGMVGNTWTAASARRSQAELLRHQLDGEARRALRTDKQALYARVLHELTGLVETTVRLATSKKQVGWDDDKSARFRELSDSHLKQLITAHRLRAELAVVAGPVIAEEAGKVISTLSEVAKGNTVGDNPNGVLDDLTEVMHADLKAEA